MDGDAPALDGSGMPEREISGADAPAGAGERTGIAALVDSQGGKAVRYLGVSGFNVVGHQALLFLANSVWGWTGGWANLFAASVMSIPAYLLSRRWVWQVDGKHDFRAEVLPFWVIALAGLVVSTALAAAAQALFGAGLAVNLASLVGYFIVWVAKFFLLGRIFNRSS